MDRKFVREALQSGKTLQEVANTLGVSRQRIGQIQQQLKLSRQDIGAAVKKQEKIIKKVEQQLVVWDKLHKKSHHRDEFDKLCYELFNRKKSNSYKTKHKWSLNYSLLEFPEVCPVLGLPLDYYCDKTKENSPSFDRVNNDLGYVDGNVKVISWRANRIKNNGTAEEHQAIANWLNSLKDSS